MCQKQQQKNNYSLCETISAESNTHFCFVLIIKQIC